MSLSRIGLILFAIFFIILVLYAIPQTRATVETLLGPPLEYVGITTTTAISDNWIWKDLITPFPNQLLILGALFWIPVAYLWHQNFNKIRTAAVKSAARESGTLPVMTEPISQPVYTPPVAPTPSVPAQPQPQQQPTTPQPEKPQEG